MQIGRKSLNFSRWLLLPFCTWTLTAQTPEMARILERLDRLEQQNRELLEQIKSLRNELAASQKAPAESGAEQAATLDERVTVQERRVEEQAQSKVESSQRFPIRITGMALFNGFLNSQHSGGTQYPTLAVPAIGASGGATVRQTVIGLEFRGPETIWGGRVHGNLNMDFLGGKGTGLNQALRVRTASIDIDWKSRSITAGLEKPIFSPREPNSLAQVGVSPLTGAGNLWLWIPQVRLEQRVHFSDRSGVRLQLGVVQTREGASYQATSYQAEVEPNRPGYEGRLEIFHGLPGERRFEIAPGFHYSVSHTAETSVPSRVFSLDWFANPWRKLEFTGAFFRGQNVAHLGTGGTRQGYTALGPRNVIAVHSLGGWAQLTWLPTARLSFNLFSGQQDDRNRDLLSGRIGKNLAYGANLFYRVAPNVIIGLETSQLRTSYLGSGTLLNNHYDLALAYLF